MDNLRFRNLAFGALIVATVNSFAETPPPAIPFDAITWKASIKKKPSTGIRMGLFHVRFEKTTLDDVLKNIAVGNIAHQGDASESIYWICYTNVKPTHVERIWIVSHGEMGGSKHGITNINAELLMNASATTDCPALPERMKPLVLDSQLWLGSSELDARKKFGLPSHQEGSWKFFDYQGKVRGNCEGQDFDVFNNLWLRIENGRVNFLHASQVTSC
jgi:hypothetical protein